MARKIMTSQNEENPRRKKKGRIVILRCSYVSLKISTVFLQTSVIFIPNEINKLRASIISMLHPEQSPQEQSDNILSDANIQRFNDISKARGIGPGVNMAWMRSLYNALFCVFFGFFYSAV